MAGKKEYQKGLDVLVVNKDKERSRQLVGVTAQALKHFFDREEYGTLPINGDTLPATWPYVRYLVFDALRPTFDYGPSQFIDFGWKDKFLRDVADEAQQITKLLPEDLKHEEWLFMVSVAAYMMMEDPMLIEKGWISERGRQGLEMQTFKSAMATGDMYEMHFDFWKKNAE